MKMYSKKQASPTSLLRCFCFVFFFKHGISLRKNPPLLIRVIINKEIFLRKHLSNMDNSVINKKKSLPNFRNSVQEATWEKAKSAQDEGLSCVTLSHITNPSLAKHQNAFPSLAVLP